MQSCCSRVKELNYEAEMSRFIAWHQKQSRTCVDTLSLSKWIKRTLSAPRGSVSWYRASACCYAENSTSIKTIIIMNYCYLFTQSFSPIRKCPKSWKWPRNVSLAALIRPLLDSPDSKERCFNASFVTSFSRGHTGPSFMKREVFTVHRWGTIQQTVGVTDRCCRASISLYVYFPVPGFINWC